MTAIKISEQVKSNIALLLLATDNSALEFDDEFFCRHHEIDKAYIQKTVKKIEEAEEAGDEDSINEILNEGDFLSFYSSDISFSATLNDLLNAPIRDNKIHVSQKIDGWDEVTTISIFIVSPLIFTS